MPPKLDSMAASDSDDTKKSKGKEKEKAREATSGDRDRNVPASEDHFPKERTERDLSIRMALRQAGYDVSKLKDGAELDEAARGLLKAKTTRTRVVVRAWPRDPKGKYITPDNTQPGKTTSSGVQLWGATIYDFFRVRRIPDLPSLSTLTTGSKLAAWMRKHGEEKYAGDEMEWTTLEEDPKELSPFDIAKLFGPMDVKIAKGRLGSPMPPVDVTDETNQGGCVRSNEAPEEERETGEENKKEKEAACDDEEDRKEDGMGDVRIHTTPQPNAAAQPRPQIPFDLSSYPAPWPIVPFTYPAPNLENYIPLNRLPKKLVVHDPWNLLSAKDYYLDDDEENEPLDWTGEPDITHVYELKLSQGAIKRLEAEEAEIEKEKAKLKEGLGDSYVRKQGFLIRPTQTQPGPIEPPVYVVHSPPPEPEPVEEAHLYISPSHSAGRGNHSIVYKAEWEVPRSMLLPHTLCRECVMKDIEEILKEQDGEDGSKKKACWKEKSARLERVEHVKPGVSISLVAEGQDFETNDGKTTRKKVDKNADIYNISPGEVYSKMEFEGPVRPIETRVSWVSPDAPYSARCSHMKTARPYPPTTKVVVMAKLSLQYDKHLAVEAHNYQKFPKHFFEHWNGLNLLPPLHDPTPVGAVVPQFYGYYIPVGANQGTDHKENTDDDDDPEQTDTDSNSTTRRVSTRSERKPYLSPIMLLENCGVPLNPNDLNIDDKNECAALYYRFHCAGWVHGSIAQRNILVQPGPLTVSPSVRGKSTSEGEGQLSFRLIDFGRSCPLSSDNRSGAEEEMSVSYLFGHMGY
ncbi:hypothetical protein BDZ94DRAFT_1321506 [Collybia nuda]|uniref:Protein kinase domain-containing protein n=1 Tax=Collybia nuda TaxID=64659 RepID=A0A9P5Y862_9AGAR|nr:hypothetical protein BDZ94DRAFT_1321506 [Collybia nuda]